LASGTGKDQEMHLLFAKKADAPVVDFVDSV
jgi:hypothetical protein